MRSMAMVTTTKYGAVRATLPYFEVSNGMPCVRFCVHSTPHAYSRFPRHRVNPRQERHAPSDSSPQNGQSRHRMTRTAFPNLLTHLRI